MSTERCTQLIAKSMYYKFDEVWISEQPFLFVSYLMVVIYKSFFKHIQF